MATPSRRSPLHRATSTPAMLQLGTGPASPRAGSPKAKGSPRVVHLGALRTATLKQSKSAYNLRPSQPSIMPLKTLSPRGSASVEGTDRDSSPGATEDWSPVDPASPSVHHVAPAHAMQAQLRQAAAVMREATKTYVVKYDFTALLSQELTVKEGERVRLAGMSQRPAQLRPALFIDNTRFRGSTLRPIMYQHMFLCSD